MRKQKIVLWLGLAVFAGIAAALFQGYLTPEMLIYFASLRWCF